MWSKELKTSDIAAQGDCHLKEMFWRARHHPSDLIVRKIQSEFVLVHIPIKIMFSSLLLIHLSTWNCPSFKKCKALPTTIEKLVSLINVCLRFIDSCRFFDSSSDKILSLIIKDAPKKKRKRIRLKLRNLYQKQVVPCENLWQRIVMKNHWMKLKVTNLVSKLTAKNWEEK